MATSVFDRLQLIRSGLTTARTYERVSPDEPVVQAAAVEELLTAADVAAGLPSEVLAAMPDLPWQRLVSLLGWREGAPVPTGAAVWQVLAEVEAVGAAVILVGGCELGFDPFAGGTNGWFTTADGSDDYTYAAEQSATAGQGRLLLPGVGEFAFDHLSTSALWIQLGDDAAAAFGGEAGMAASARRLGLGRVRADGSAPLEPRPDQIWVQDALGDAVVIARHAGSETGYAYLVTSGLARAARTLAVSSGHVQVFLLNTDEFLPRALTSVERQVGKDERSWGGLVAATVRA